MPSLLYGGQESHPDHYGEGIQGQKAHINKPRYPFTNLLRKPKLC